MRPIFSIRKTSEEERRKLGLGLYWFKVGLSLSWEETGRILAKIFKRQNKH